MQLSPERTWPSIQVHPAVTVGQFSEALGSAQVFGHVGAEYEKVALSPQSMAKIVNQAT